MNLIPIKICGLTREQDVLDAASAGANAVGFVLYPPSRFHWDSRAVGLLLAAIGVGGMVVQGGLLRVVIPRLG
ncbi:MAG: hypothetical protein ACKO69_07455, partial [Limnohabitans sp.]